MSDLSKRPNTVAIMVSTYNWPEALERCVQTILAQDRLPDEILIADDGSGEATKQAVERLKSLSKLPIHHIWHPDEGFRLSVIRNKAIEAAQSEYIIQIDGDILLDPHFISDHLSLIEPNAFLCGSRVWVDQEQSKELLEQKGTIKVDRSKFPLSFILNSMRSGFLSRFLADRYKKNQPKILRGCNMSFWKSDLIKVNGYNESIQGWGAEDSEMAFRLMNSGVKKRFLKFAAVAYHLYHKENNKDNLAKNDLILEETIDQKKTWTDFGIKKDSKS
ncbi:MULTISPECIES: glycosyltransferase family 2 protein [Sphingobacterium]|uniref:Glycosyl transferase family 2 n=1 Tax=Sphingobacterium cellulitidis TaxID=1768011 RepID=A0A8H9FWG1_9SPHI|nr:MULTISPECIES: glycosyltransferase family 2 protein [Sphingobacterium]MBA8985837.1 glycosyltransferase involved in cell wall biosynthesis [Sphingobacterium soli]WFB64247.1 glycosyltransferase family 2 protein [Sphingobacterium sp. WM]GGE06508.1 glycosyl transferase family 2 [Sphingobacterium soli]